MRNHRLHRSTSRSCPSSSTGCGGSSTAATTRPASPSCATASIELRRSAGKLAQPRGGHRDATRSTGDYGIGHTRWATHGRPTEENAHPHRDCTGQIVVVHNGIIENYLDLKQAAAAGRATRSSPRPTPRSSRTWSSARCKDDGLENAVRRALLYMRGLFALVLISADDPEQDRHRPQRPADRRRPRRGRVLRRLRHPGDPQPHPRRRVPRRRGDGDHHAGRRRVHRLLRPRGLEEEHARVVGSGHGGEGRLQALHAQGDLRAAEGRQGDRPRPRVGRDRPGLPRRRSRSRDAGAARRSSGSSILACGTSWHAALVGKFLIESLARVPVEVDYGSEYRYRDPIVSKNTLAIVITQSGETADTLAALREAKKKGAPQHRDLQRRRQHGDARDRRHRLHARRAGDRRRVDQGVHVAAGRAAPAGAVPRPDPRHADARTRRGRTSRR